MASWPQTIWYFIEITYIHRSNDTHLNVIANRIDKCMEGFGKQISSFFVRLSSRSPKDSIFEIESFTDVFKAELVALKNDYVDYKESFSAKNISFYRASTKALAVLSGKEALGLLLVSKRINGDIKALIEKNETINLIVREFVEFSVENELRLVLGLLKYAPPTNFCVLWHKKHIWATLLEIKIKKKVYKYHEHFKFSSKLIKIWSKQVKVPFDGKAWG